MIDFKQLLDPFRSPAGNAYASLVNETSAFREFRGCEFTPKGCRGLVFHA
jgi:hypothetical protein